MCCAARVVQNQFGFSNLDFLESTGSAWILWALTPALLSPASSSPLTRSPLSPPPPSPYLVCDGAITSNGSHALVEPSLVVAKFLKAWMPFFRVEGRRGWPSASFSDRSGVMGGRSCYGSVLLVVWMGGFGMRFKLCRFLGVRVLQPFFGMWCPFAAGHRGAVTPKAEGDSTLRTYGPQTAIVYALPRLLPTSP